MGKTITKTVKQKLMCRLTEAELEEEGRKLTDLLQEKMTLEVEKSASNKHYSDAIKGVDGRIEKQIPVVRDREIERDVECLVEYNVPEKGLKRITRLDTGEVVEKSEMTSDECQDLFLNAENDAPAGNAAPLGLPAPEEDGEIIDAEEVPVSEEAQTIHVTFDDYNEDITPVNGQLYEIKGGLYRAVESPANNCEQCVFRDTPNAPIICPKFACEDFIFVHADGSDGEGTLHVCSKCGLALRNLFHVDNEKLMCEYCMENAGGAKKAAAFLAENHQQFGVRASFGYGCRREVADATCFRLRPLGSDHSVTEGGAVSWGMHHYKAGDYQQEGTPAHEYYQHLLSIGGVEA